MEFAKFRRDFSGVTLCLNRQRLTICSKCMSKISAKPAVKVECCFVCKDEEKRDFNLDYGTYYHEDGGRRENVVEVSFTILSF